MVKFPRNPKWLEAEARVKEIQGSLPKIPLNLVENIRGNSYFWESLYPNLDNNALCRFATTAIDNCSFDQKRPWRSYNEAVMGQHAPLLLQRLRELSPVITKELEDGSLYWAKVTYEEKPKLYHVRFLDPDPSCESWYLQGVGEMHVDPASMFDWIIGPLPE